MRAFIFAVAILFCPPLARAEPPASDAQSAATTWLKMVDGAAYAQSWDTASPYLKERITEAAWADKIRQVREPLGAVAERAMIRETNAKSLPGMPDGNYTILQFHARFANKADALETVTLIPDNGVPKVGGYFLK